MALQAAFVSPAAPRDHGSNWLDSSSGPKPEARGLLALVRKESVESVRELIGISPQIEEVLQRYMRTHPEDAAGIEKVLRFRKHVREEFDRLIGKAAPNTTISSVGSESP